ncbi:B9 domain-containing protein 2-like protein [Zopfochytrium polystomum]|nr:B9 domain-containing protein 2-like protein [Zopfochytrium polystomum]
MAEVHVIGSLVGASGFPRPELTARWSIVAGESWTLIEGDDAGQTQVDLPEDGRFTVWSHPIDVHYGTKTIAGWPKIVFQVFHQDMFGRNELYGYGFVHIPTTPGRHLVDCVTWRPAGTIMDQVWTFFLGATPQLKSLDLVHNPSDRFRLQTTAMGKVHIDVTVIVRNFDRYDVSL